MAKEKQAKNGNLTKENSGNEIQYFNILNIVPSPFEPQAKRRTHFKKEELEELANSIKQNGLIQPIVVRPSAEIGMMEIIAGERRFLSSKIAKLTELPCLVRNVSDETAFEIQMQENLNRKDINPLDEAYSFKYLVEHHKLTAADIATKFGRKEALVLRRLKLGDLIPEALKDIADAFLPLGHAEEIALYPPDAQKEILKTCTYKWNNKKDGYEPFDKVKRNILNNIVLNLQSAVFDKEATDLRDDGLACINCDQRTGFMPKLFDTAITKDDHCLNKNCFESKLTAHFQNLKRQVALMSSSIENPPVEDAENKVLMVSESWIPARDKTKFGEGEYLDYQNLLEKEECAGSRPALVIDGEKRGEIAFVCTNEECEIHHNEADIDDKPSEWQLKNNEREFQRNVGLKTRAKVFIEAMDIFSEAETFWNNEEMLRKLLFRLIENNSYKINNYGSVTEIFSAFAENPKEWTKNDKNIKKLIALLDLKKQSQLLFLLTYIEEDLSSYESVPQDNIKYLAEKYTGLNYDNLFAETFLELAPDEFKPTAEEYLTKIRAGESAEIPHLYWTAQTETASDEDEELDLESEDGDDEFHDEDDVDENDLGETTQG